MAELSISQVARQAGIQPSTLRYYESIGLLPIPSRVGGRRRYDASILQQLTLIKTAQHAGFSLDEVRILFNDILPSAAPTAQWQALVQRKLREVSALMQHVQQMKRLLEDVLTCRDEQLADCIYVIGQKHKLD